MNTAQEKSRIKQRIIEDTLRAKKRNEEAISSLKDSVCLSEYRDLARVGQHGLIWTDALQAALNEHEIVIIPESEEIYWLDNTVSIPSNRRIEATGATIRMSAEYPYVMLRNQHVHDGTYAPIDTNDRDTNISIHGGCWDEGAIKRGVRRYHGESGSFAGVQTCMLFNNLDHLTITDITFSHVTSFCVQVGDLVDGIFENFFFISCYADGLHINGNSENLYIRNFSGHVGDDLVALNMYDWLGSSINYGPARNVFCENIHSAPDSRAKAMRLQPGIFAYRDGTLIDCSLCDMYFRNLSGIFEYKLYYQTPPYRLGTKPEGAGAGSADNLFFENVEIIYERPGCPYELSKVGYFGMFFLNSNIGYISLDNIRYKTTEDASPYIYLVAIGPMSWRRAGKEDIEVFDPYVSTTVDTLDMKNIFINGKQIDNAEKILKIIEFDDVNQDGFSSGKGKVNHIYIDGKSVL
ncbi:MAG: hypothetical protein IJY65_01950 [Clostridia bacterium]|nr:hypothetical protein [Clostridia bacterium]